MTIYAWTISKPGRKDIQHVTTLSELCDYLCALDLPGVAPPELSSGEYSHVMPGMQANAAEQVDAAIKAAKKPAID